MGILANMACTKEVCELMVEHSRLRYFDIGIYIIGYWLSITASYNETGEESILIKYLF